MSLTTLPMEVLEILLLYVGKEDLLNVWSVLKMKGSDSFWKKVCRNYGYKRLSYEDECWRSIFERNLNWYTQSFVERKYKLSKFKDGRFDLTGTEHNCSAIHGKNLILRSVEEQCLVFDIDSTPECLQTLTARNLRISGSKIATNSPSGTSIYTKENNIYQKLFGLPFDFTHSSCYYSLSDSFFATFEDNFMSVKVVKLTDSTDFSLVISSKKPNAYSLYLSGIMLYILLLEGNQYIMKRFNLEEKERHDDLVLFQGAALISIPKVKFSPSLIVSWSDHFEERGTTSMKIWSSNGEILRRESLGCSEHVLWLIVEGKYAIYSFSKTKFTIWNSLNPEKCIKVPMEENLYSGQSIISSSLLVLSYCYGFKVVDFEKPTYLYEVQFGNFKLNSINSKLRLPLLFFVNEYFYVILQEYDENDVELMSLVDIPSTLVKNNDAKLCLEDIKNNKFITMCIYDFRGK